MLSELRTRKIARLFQIIDADGDGALNRSDYTAIAGNIADARGWIDGSPERAAVLGRYTEVWDQLKRAADSDGDGIVRRTEHATFHERLLAEPGGFDRVPAAMVNLLLEGFDRDQDGALSVEDLGDCFRAYRIDEALAAKAFAHLDTDGDGLVSRAEAMNRVKEFYLSDDPSAPGNWLFGEL